MPKRCAMVAMRKPYTPLAATSSLPSLGRAVPMTDSTAKVPLPCMSTLE